MSAEPSDLIRRARAAAPRAANGELLGLLADALEWSIISARFHERIEERTHPMLCGRLERAERVLLAIAETHFATRQEYNDQVGEIANEHARRASVRAHG